MSELEREGIGIGLLAQIEDKFGLRSLVVRGGHEVGKKGFKRGKVRAKNSSKLGLLKLRGRGIH